MSDTKAGMPSLSVAIVTYRSDCRILKETLESLKTAIGIARLAAFEVVIIENSPSNEILGLIEQTKTEFPIRVVFGQGNVGFGRAHNLLLNTAADFHLVLNPDVAMAPNALSEALSFMERNPDCGLITPRARSEDGTTQYLCKRFPPVLDLFLRGFAPPFTKSVFRHRLMRYEMRDLIFEDSVYWDPPIVSGCFMFFRTPVFQKVSGFDPRYFLYFEDFDISLRVGLVSRIAYVPTVCIVHHGGHAALKGVWHVKQFLKSAVLFYHEHGLRLL